jgi:uncharacterized protein (TIGR03435 family)
MRPLIRVCRYSPCLQEQLGLRVEEGRGPVDVLVVDGIQRPTEN